MKYLDYKTANTKGVTLIEILISLAILTIVTGGLSTGTNYLTKRLVRAEKASTARQLAWSQLAKTRAMPLLYGHFQGNFGDQFPDFTYDETILPANYNGRKINNLYSYEISVMWQQAYSVDSVKLKTFIAEYPAKKKRKVKDKK